MLSEIAHWPLAFDRALEEGKSVRLWVDRAKAAQQSRLAWKPAPDHPWRQPFKPEADAAG